MKRAFMDHKLFLALLLASSLFWMWGCGKDLEELEPNNQKVVFWYQYTQNREETLLELVEDFNSNNPYSIEVEARYAGHYPEIYNKMTSGGSLPQLVVAYHNQAWVYHQDGDVVDLIPYMDSPKWGIPESERAEYIEDLLKLDHAGGVQVALRPHFSTELLYYNADWLAELGYIKPPQNWKEFARLCRLARKQPFSRATHPERSVGLLLGEDASRVASMIFSRGGSLINSWHKAYLFDNPPVKKSMKMLRELYQEDAIGIFSDLYVDRREFSAGRVLFMMRSSSNIPAVEDDVASGLGFDWGAALVPYEEMTPVNNIYGAGWAVCESTPEQQLAAWLFIKWFIEADQQSRWAKGSNYFPIRRIGTPELASFLQAAFNTLKYGKTEPPIAGYEIVRRLMADATISIMKGADMDQTLANLESMANQTIVNR